MAEKLINHKSVKYLFALSITAFVVLNLTYIQGFNYLDMLILGAVNAGLAFTISLFLESKFKLLKNSF